MRHAKRTFKIGKTSSHRKCMMSNMLKSLVEHGRVKTTLRKAKELKREADQLITLAKRDTLHSRRQAISSLKITFNALTPKERKQAKNGDLSPYNTDRRVIGILFNELKERFASRNGGYTRIIKTPKCNRGDGSEVCFVEYLA